MTRARRVRAFPALAAALVFLTAPAHAHDSRPLFVEITETAKGEIELRSTAPGAVEAQNAPVVTLAPPCVESHRAGGDPRRSHAAYNCAIEDATIKISWPTYNPSLSTLVRITFANGETRTAILDPSQNEWRAPPPDDFQGVAKSYFIIGGEHILGGIDHLLFLAGLLIIAGGLRRTLITVTGFTVAHSLTLALVALGLLRVSIPATEAVIALSIVFLATEIARGDRSTIAWRRPAIVACAFGLVHGAGFAAALGEIGLPKSETLAALLFFNLGVEAGQIAIVATAFAAILAARQAALLRAPVGGNLVRLCGYALGIISAYWFVERLAALFSV